MIVWKWR